MIVQATRRTVAERADHRCEYCQLPQSLSPLARLQLEHIVPRKHGGDDSLQNLALACIDCNLRKGPNLTGIDPQTGWITPLFNPRLQAWIDHFAWEGQLIVGRTDIGRTTVEVLDLNLSDRLLVRSIRSGGPS